jgi:hypothetical protein
VKHRPRRRSGEHIGNRRGIRKAARAIFRGAEADRRKRESDGQPTGRAPQVTYSKRVSRRPSDRLSAGRERRQGR